MWYTLFFARLWNYRRSEKVWLFQSNSFCICICRYFLEIIKYDFEPDTCSHLQTPGRYPAGSWQAPSKLLAGLWQIPVRSPADEKCVFFKNMEQLSLFPNHMTKLVSHFFTIWYVICQSIFIMHVQIEPSLSHICVYWFDFHEHVYFVFLMLILYYSKWQKHNSLISHILN